MSSTDLPQPTSSDSKIVSPIARAAEEQEAAEAESSSARSATNESMARAQLENSFEYNEEDEEEEDEDEEGQDEVTELVSTTVAKPILGGENTKGGNNDDDQVPELGPGEGFMLKDLNTGKMVHIVNDIDSFFDEINFTTFEEIRGKAENAAKQLHGPNEKLTSPEILGEEEGDSDNETDEFLHYMRRGESFTVQIRAHAFAMDHNRKIYAVYFVDIKLEDDENTSTRTSTSNNRTSTATTASTSEEEVTIGSSQETVDGDAISNNAKTYINSSDTKTVGAASQDAQEKAPRSWTVFRRYNHFRGLQEKLKKLNYSVASLPPKRLFKSNFDPEFLRERRAQLEEWLQGTLALKRDSATKSQVPSGATSIDREIDMRRFLTAKANTPPFRMTTPVVAADSQSEFSKRMNENPTQQTVSLADFQLIQMLGVGAYGRVILVEHRINNTLYAMKVLSKAAAIEAKQMEYINTERRLLAKLRHPFICSLHYAFQTARKLYLILDYCPGGELFTQIGRHSRFSERRTRFYTAELVLALGHIHSIGVVYRDLKPENVLLDSRGHVKLVDFGLSKDGVKAISGCTFSFCGTPEYLAPEIIEGVGHGTGVDWWSLGMLVFEMLTGLPPWYTKDRTKLFANIISARLRFPEYVSPTARSFIQGLLTRSPIRRLGARGLDQVKDHPFFSVINWDVLERQEVKAPFAPSTTANPKDTRHFDPAVTTLPLERQFTDDKAEEDVNVDFTGFKYDKKGSVSKIAKDAREEYLKL